MRVCRFIEAIQSGIEIVLGVADIYSAVVGLCMWFTMSIGEIGAIRGRVVSQVKCGSLKWRRKTMILKVNQVCLL